MKIFDKQITFAEVPDEVSLTFFVPECPRNCKNCSWKGNVIGEYEYPINLFSSELQKYLNKVTTITFLGGEWYPDFVSYVDISLFYGFKVCLYTGESSYDVFCRKFLTLSKRLTFLKTGEYIDELGGLNSKRTNQRFYELENGKIKKEIKFYEL